MFTTHPFDTLYFIPNQFSIESFQTTTGYMHLAATEEATVSDADQPIAKLDLNIIYIFAGAGIIIVMLIFGILVHLFKKSKSLERKLVIQQTFCENEKNTETLSQTQNLSRRYSSSNVQPCNKDHFYRTIEADYDEINEEFEMQVSPGDNRLRNENISMQGVVVTAQNAEESRIRTNISDLYLEPLFVPETQESQNEEEINSNHSLEVIKET